MNYKDIQAMAAAYTEVAEASSKARALANVKAQPKDKVSLAKAPWDKKDAKKESMDPVDKSELKGKHKDRKDKDIDNDGDVDSSDKYLHKRRKAVSKAIGKDKEVEIQTQESVEEDLSNMSNARLKYHATKKFPHGSYTKSEIAGEHKRRKKSEPNYDSVKPSLNEAPRRKGAPKMTGDSFAIQRAKDNAHDDAMGRTKTGRKKPVRTMTSTQRSLASMRNEAKGHGNTDNGMKAGESLSPSAKKEIDRKTPMNPATDEPAVDKKTFDAIRASGKKAPMRNGDNAAGDKAPIANKK